MNRIPIIWAEEIRIAPRFGSARAMTIDSRSVEGRALWYVVEDEGLVTLTFADDSVAKHVRCVWPVDRINQSAIEINSSG